MTPAFANRIAPPPTGALSRPVWFSIHLGDFVLFHDAGMLYAYRSTGGLAWHIEARIAIAGFAVVDDNLYVQDGDVLCQYHPSALQTVAPQTVAVRLPLNAISFRTAVPSGWSLESGDGGAGSRSRRRSPIG